MLPGKRCRGENLGKAVRTKRNTSPIDRPMARPTSMEMQRQPKNVASHTKQSILLTCSHTYCSVRRCADLLGRCCTGVDFREGSLYKEEHQVQREGSSRAHFNGGGKANQVVSQTKHTILLTSSSRECCDAEQNKLKKLRWA